MFLLSTFSLHGIAAAAAAAAAACTAHFVSQASNSRLLLSAAGHSHGQTKCTYRDYRSNKCPDQPSSGGINFWEVLMSNPFGRPSQPPAGGCTTSSTAVLCAVCCVLCSAVICAVPMSCASQQGFGESGPKCHNPPLSLQILTCSASACGDPIISVTDDITVMLHCVLRCAVQGPRVLQLSKAVVAQLHSPTRAVRGCYAGWTPVPQLLQQRSVHVSTPDFSPTYSSCK
jgi:hypothetical protein